jgi:hypothetical protein
LFEQPASRVEPKTTAPRTILVRFITLPSYLS